MSQVTTLTTEKQIEQESGVDSSMSAQHRDSKVVTPGHYNVEQDIETALAILEDADSNVPQIPADTPRTKRYRSIGGIPITDTNNDNNDDDNNIVYNNDNNDNTTNIVYKHDDDEEEEEEEKYHISSLGQNPGNLSARSHLKELIEDTLNRIKIALTFLFHDLSPLTEKRTDRNWFCDRVQEYDVNPKADFELFSAKINKLYNPSFRKDHEKMYNEIWKVWQEYAYKYTQNGYDQNEDEKDAEILKFDKMAQNCILDQEESLEESIDDFMQTKYVLKKKNQSLLGAFQKSVTKRNNVPMLKEAYSSAKNKEDQDNNDNEDYTKYGSSSEDELMSIDNRQKMNEWIKKWKEKEDHIIRKTISCFCCKSCKKKAYDIESSTTRELTLSIPMDLFDWEMCVAFIEDNDIIAHFAPIIWQFKINGKELCKMQQKQLELLTEISILKNNHDSFDEIDFDHFKSTINPKQYELTQETNKFVHYKNKQRILSHVVSKYHLTIDTIQEIIDNHEDKIYAPFYRDAVNISDLITFLRCDPALGPKQYWKTDDYFFNKIDNYLSVLICDDLIMNIFKLCNPFFLTTPDKPPSDLAQQIIEQNNLETKSLKRMKSKAFIEQEVIQANSNGIKSITNQLNSFYKERNSQNKRHQYGRSSVALLKENIEKRLETSCINFIRNRDTIYAPLLCIVIVTILIGSIFIITWWNTHALDQIDSAMFLASEALSQRVKNRVIDQFFVPQMLISLTIGALYDGDINITRDNHNNDENARFLSQFANIAHTESIFSLGIYIVESDEFIGAYNNSEDDKLWIINYNSTCRKDYLYDSGTDDDNICTQNWKPTDRPWYKVAISNFNHARWTDTYLFAEGDYGMSLVTGIEFNSLTIIILCEITVNTLSENALISDNLLLPQGSIIMIATHGLDIFASSNKQIYLNNCTETDCQQSDDERIISSVKYLRDNNINGQYHETLLSMDDIDKSLSISILSFEMIYLDFIPEESYSDDDNDTTINLIKPLMFEDPSDYQYGYVVIVNDDTYLNALQVAFIVSFVVTGLVLIASIMLICHNMRYHHRIMAQDTIRMVSKRFGNVDIFNSSIELSTIIGLSDGNTPIKQTILPKVGDKAKVKANNKIGTIQHIGNLEDNRSASKNNLRIVVLKLEENNETMFTKLENIEILEEKQSMFDTNYNGTYDIKQDDETYNFDQKMQDKDKNMDMIQETIEQLQSIVNNDVDTDIDSNKCQKKTAAFFYLKQKQLLTVSFLGIVFTFTLLIFIWFAALSGAKTELVEEIMAKQEFASVSDQVYRLYTKTEMLKSIIIERNNRGDMDLNDASSRNIFLSNLMQSFVDPLPIYGQYYIYIGTPDGKFLGVRWSESATDYDLQVGIRDSSTGWESRSYALNDDVTIIDNDDSGRLYDPRCRPWYNRAMQYTMKGTAQNAFPPLNISDTESGWKDFLQDERLAAQTDACADSRELYTSMFNMSSDLDSNQPSDYLNNEYQYTGEGGDVKYDIVWSRYIFSSLSQVGLTASAMIQDDETGDVLGVLGIDFTLQQLSSFLYDSVKQHQDSIIDSNSSDFNWYSWIFNDPSTDPDPEKNETYELIASSEFNILRDTLETEGCFGISSATDSTTIPYDPQGHPNYYIRTLSHVVINVEEIQNIPINPETSISVNVPIEFPILEVARISFEPVLGEASINWVVLKTVSDQVIGTVDNIEISSYVSLLLFASILFMIKEIDYIQNDNDNDDDNDYDNEIDDFEEVDRRDPNYYYYLMEKIKPIIIGATNADWSRIIENENDLDDEILYKDNVLSNLGDILDDKPYEISILTTKHAKQYMANLANEHISDESDFNDKLIEYAWQASTFTNYHNTNKTVKWFRLKFFQFINTNLYSIPNQLILSIHLIITLFEPPTPQQLQEEGLKDYLIYGTFFCIIFEVLDCICICYRRYIEFSISEPFLTNLYQLNYGKRHKYTKQIKKCKSMNKIRKRVYLIFFGPNSTIYCLHIIITTLILIDFAFRVSVRKGLLSYYFPILPILLIIRNETILEFVKEFGFSIYYARNVLFSYLCFILIFSLLAMSLFKSVVNEKDFSESFASITKSIITSFVYISTSENYTILYDILGAGYFNTSTDPEVPGNNNSILLLVNSICFVLLFAMIGLFIFIPTIIHQFELAFQEAKILEEEENIRRKENAIVSAFILLDMNGDLDIDKYEFDALVSSSILVDKSKLFDAFDDDKNESIDINEFVSNLKKQTFRTKVMSLKIPKQNRFRAWFECNVLRHRLYKNYILILLVLPFLLLSVMKGVGSGVDDGSLNLMLYIFFGLNFAEIHFKAIIYGFNRFFDRLKYPNPRYITAAINKYIDKTDQDMSTRLNESDKEWVNINLSPVRPLSVLEKSTITLINKIEIALIWMTLLLFLLFKYAIITDEIGDDGIDWSGVNEEYCLFFIQFGVLIRIFLIIPSNQKLIYVIFTVFPQFMSLFAFLILFIYTYARIGCTLFGDNKTAIVIDEIYDQSSNITTNFNDLAYSMLALLQLMVGEGWHEIMYFNVIATHPLMATYFLLYIIMVSIIISNTFVGLFLADIDELSDQQSNDEILQSSHKIQSFEQFAHHHMKILNHKLKMADIQREKIQKNLLHLENLLNHHKLKQKGNEFDFQF